MQSENYLVSSWIKNETTLYFVPVNLNIVVIYNKSTGIKKLLPIREENFTQNNLYSQCLRYENKIIFIPLHAKNLLFLDINNYEMEYVSISRSIQKDPGYGYFSGGIIKDENLYAIGYLFPGILKYNLVSREMQVIDINILEIGNLAYSYALSGEDGISCATNMGNIVTFFFNNDEIEIKKCSEYSFSGITSNAERIWAFDNNKKCIIEYNSKNAEIFKIYLHDYIGCYEKALYRYIKYVNGFLFLLPSKNAPIIIYSIKENKFSLLWENESNNEGFSTIASSVYDKKLYLTDYYKKRTYEINSVNLRICDYKIPIDKEIIIDSIANDREIYLIEDAILLKDYINYLKHCNKE